MSTEADERDEEYTETQWNGLPGALIESETNPWIKNPSGEAIKLLPGFLGGGCGESIHWTRGVLTSMDSDEGIQRCDACGIYPGDLEAAAAVAKIYGPGFTVWFHGTNGESSMIEQTSASDRYEAARKALAEYEAHGTFLDDERAASALRTLITPPSVGLSVEQIAENIERAYGGRLPLVTLLQMAVRAGIQSAHETWEPEVALRPTQEQMLRWMEIEHEINRHGDLYIPEQHIEREEA